MLVVWFTTGDLAASARFNADSFDITDSGRLSIYDVDNNIVAMFNIGTWVYISSVESEVVNEA